MRDGFVDQCYATLLNSVISTSHQRVTEALKYCTTFAGKTRSQCFGEVGSLARAFGNDACGSLNNGQDKADCKKSYSVIVQPISE